VGNEAVVRLPFSDTWDLLIGQLAKSFFVINNVEKVSRIINVSFSTDKPEEYIDCGTTERTFQYANESQTHTDPVAGSSSFKVAGKWGEYDHLPLIGYVDRKTSLEGRINVYVPPKCVFRPIPATDSDGNPATILRVLGIGGRLPSA